MTGGTIAKGDPGGKVASCDAAAIFKSKVWNILVSPCQEMRKQNTVCHNYIVPRTYHGIIIPF